MPGSLRHHPIYSDVEEKESESTRQKTQVIRTDLKEY